MFVVCLRFQSERSSSHPGAEPKRKQKGNNNYKNFRFRLTCLDGPSITKVNGHTFKRCLEKGLGKYNDGETLSLPINTKKEELDEFVRKKFPSLDGDFDFCRVNKEKKCQKLELGDYNKPLKQLRKKRSLGRSAIYIRPQKQQKLENDNISTSSSDTESTEGVNKLNMEAAVIQNDNEQVPVIHTRQICMVCGKTKISEECLHCLQDQEFQESLAKDREKQMQCPAKILELDQDHEEDLHLIRIARRENLPKEPTHGFLVKIRVENGESYQRKFESTNKVKVLLDFIGSLPESSKSFKIWLPGSGQLDLKTPDSILADIGISNPAVLNVSWNTDDFIPEVELDSNEDDEIVFDKRQKGLNPSISEDVTPENSLFCAMDCYSELLDFNDDDLYEVEQQVPGYEEDMDDDVLLVTKPLPIYQNQE